MAKELSREVRDELASIIAEAGHDQSMRLVTAGTGARLVNADGFGVFPDRPGLTINLRLLADECDGEGRHLFARWLRLVSDSGVGAG